MLLKLPFFLKPPNHSRTEADVAYLGNYFIGKSKLFSLKIMTLSLTEKAAEKLTKFLQDSNKGIRISVVDGGCSGYQYSLNIANAPKADDLLLEKDKLQIFIDPISAPLLDGVVVDYIEGLTESGLKFINPNATETCSCGKSFQAGGCTPTGVPCS
uniref:HesB/IscA family protein n=1 Tax=Okeania sp. SIO2F4 TaxID=2607790 RepID=UPI0025F9B142|nr:iron-sulfur cluster assembly accessory protein [Okeania sp. SIO2F4]